MSANILAFPGGYNPKEVDGMAIDFAAKVKGDYWGKVTRGVILYETDDGALGFMSAGEAIDGYRLMGMLEAAKLMVFADED